MVLERNEKGELTGLVTNIQKYTIHDGPGIRTEIFFKGCNMHCPWCSNPETIAPRPQLGVYPGKCIGRDKCDWCVKACPMGSDSPICFDENGTVLPISMAAQCANCYRCAAACPGGGLIVWGKPYTVAELMKIIEEDRSFYQHTGGGVTLNGGEVMLHWEFAEALCRTCHDAGINTCVESALNVPQTHMEAVLAHTDYLITDIKHMDSEAHKAITGSGNERILANIRRASELGVQMVIRTPVVMGRNDSEENIRATAAFIRDELGGRVVQYQLLPYRKMGTEKYDTLGQSYPMGDYVPPERETWEPNLLHLRDVAKEYGINAVPGSNQKWF